MTEKKKQAGTQDKAQGKGQSERSAKMPPREQPSDRKGASANQSNKRQAGARR